MKIFVTGGCGFIGSNFVRFLLDKTQHEIVNVDALTYAANPDKAKTVSHNTNDIKNARYTFIKGDVRDADLMNTAMKGAECVVHFAAESHVDRSIQSADEFLTTNILGTKTALDAAIKNNVKKFVHISTDEVYGSIEEGKAGEDTKFAPSSPYAASKAAADLLAQAYFKTYNLPVLITRCANNFGPYQFPEKVIPLFIKKLMAGEKVPVYGNGLNRRNWIFAEDNCEAIHTILLKGKTGEAYNISGNDELSNIELTKKLLKLCNKDESYIEFVKDRLGHDFRYAVDDAKLRSLGWKPKHTFEEALKKTVEWYNANKEWIKQTGG
ncbi:MAG TPA: dTDP-glucose 4,6-dehydratase [Candidatus Nanoarchaeia archaeon]|nr:dTDP-glucose 4,6-dehydratase [Candidatus Nanoarchaeia archaeon]